MFKTQNQFLQICLHYFTIYLATPAEVIGHYYCFLLSNLDSSTICQIMLELKLLTEEELVYSAKMCSEYQKNAFLVDHLLVTGTHSIFEFCRLLQNTENQKEVGYMLVNGRKQSCGM